MYLMPRDIQQARITGFCEICGNELYGAEGVCYRCSFLLPAEEIDDDY